MKDCPKFILILFFGLFALVIFTISYFVFVEIPSSSQFDMNIPSQENMKESAIILLSGLPDPNF